MHYNLIRSKISNNYVVDPYVSMLYIKRAYKYLHLLKKNGGSIAILGNKYSELRLEKYFQNVQHRETCDLRFLTNSTKRFDLLICTDLPLYYTHLRNIFIPKMFVASGSEFVKNRNYLHVFDYFIPLTDSRLDVHLHRVLAKRYLT
ncbi:conserved Plasmodium protein, unknown function [Plasmodium ovale wallikeri]|uniref:Uncharacterized protein n=2 Tax=Plasmodium ovale TaxID=36330 RepID=A0A1C3KQZ5_PLAOA|nr:conserved Plasmodium protein, unknown function [Plasmodium ovale wallikeri]SBT76535.1 conserved Plasmodium protein, unknown function [Plasmodium ovale]